jgi:ATP-dependent DNA helicase RecG
VLYKPDGTIETAARGELRYGDHAEFALLERKNRHALLEGSILFATLEPCAPGARSHPKLGCAERIVNARIAEVYVGILDPDPLVDRKGIAYLEKHGVKIHMFPKELQDQIREANSKFLKQALLRGGDDEQDESVKLSRFEDLEVGADLADFDVDALNHYRNKLKLSEPSDSEAFHRRLKRQGLLIRKGKKWVPSGFGLMLFGSNPRDSFQQAGLLATVRYPNGHEEIRNFDEPYVLIPKLVKEWLGKVLPHSLDRNRMEREEGLDVPFKMIREAVINALVHRDYDIEGAKCQLIVDADVIEVKSPGDPLSPVTLEQIKAFNAPMLSRNPKLHYVFAQIEVAEERGLGLASLKKEAAELGLPTPLYSFEAPYLTLKIFRSAKGLEQSTKGMKSALTQLKKNQRTGWDWLVSVDGAGAPDYAEALDISRSTALNHLNRFVELGLAEKLGRGPSTRYHAVVK